ncbi:hypothetical protein ACWT_0228 [Actinoplanes sp. SE50]|nr:MULTISPECIES: hypothetical protein [unclassified Actinoplanes]AEV81240.1 hypothetical protein ACPL_343 [Actinoplanes sp. SE50/110]ATO79643.1 hypothetical protein ACWT_0228 [Actinoplanes sp. SE50]SLL97046.1 hypothetical protein ACSP50_0242 [Actinoplanes sp. SE50/110]
MPSVVGNEREPSSHKVEGFNPSDAFGTITCTQAAELLDGLPYLVERNGASWIVAFFYVLIHYHAGVELRRLYIIRHPDAGMYATLPRK